MLLLYDIHVATLKKKITMPTMKSQYLWETVDELMNAEQNQTVAF